MASLKELPHDLLAEKSLLGCLLLDGQAFDEINEYSLVRDDFYHPQYGLIYDCISNLVAENRPIEFFTVVSKLTDQGHIESLGEGDVRGQAFILSLTEEQASSANIEYYAKRIKEKSIVRTIIRKANRIIEKGTQQIEDINEFVAEVESSFFQITSDFRKEGIRTLKQCLMENLKELEDNARDPGEMTGLSTGFNMLDAKLLGMQAGQLIIVAGRPGMGKTGFGLNLAINSVKKAGLPVALFSLEMLAPELSMRLLSSEAKIDSKKLRTKNLQGEDYTKIATAIDRLSRCPIYINDRGHTTVLDIFSECRKIKREAGLGLIVIDYIQLMKSHTGNPSREQQISEISRELKQMAKELECPVLTLSQLNRGVEARSDKRPMVSDLRESGALEQDADVVLLLYRDDFYNPESPEKGMAEVIIGKNRAGETGTVKLGWIGQYTSFVPITKQYEN